MVFSSSVGDLWGDKNKTSTRNKKFSFWGRIPSDLKTSNPVSNSSHHIYLGNNLIKTILRMWLIYWFNFHQSKNPSYQKLRKTVFRGSTRQNLKILKIEWTVQFWKYDYFDWKVTKTTVYQYICQCSLNRKHIPISQTCSYIAS